MLPEARLRRVITLEKVAYKRLSVAVINCPAQSLYCCGLVATPSFADWATKHTFTETTCDQGSGTADETTAVASIGAVVADCPPEASKLYRIFMSIMFSAIGCGALRLAVGLPPLPTQYSSDLSVVAFVRMKNLFSTTVGAVVTTWPRQSVGVVVVEFELN